MYSDSKRRTISDPTPIRVFLEHSADLFKIHLKMKLEKGDKGPTALLESANAISHQTKDEVNAISSINPFM